LFFVKSQKKRKEKHRKAQKSTEKHRKAQKSTEKHRKEKVSFDLLLFLLLSVSLLLLFLLVHFSYLKTKVRNFKVTVAVACDGFLIFRQNS
jgi:phosphopantetheinyl transferase